MAIKKSELYSSLWASCDELRGSMDASQYKDYVLVMLFMKYVSDKKDPMIDIPADASFYDMVKHKGKADIGDKISGNIGYGRDFGKFTLDVNGQIIKFPERVIDTETDNNMRGTYNSSVMAANLGLTYTF